jgi:hypothetical protein
MINAPQEVNKKLFDMVLQAKAKKLKKEGKLTVQTLTAGAATLGQMGISQEYVNRRASEIISKLDAV